MSDDAYVTVTARLRARTPKAVLLDVGAAVGRGSWIPRSCLHARDDRALDAAAIDSEISVAVREWIAAREGLA
jgi:hypothetical protein